jgi:hypothetical protein
MCFDVSSDVWKIYIVISKEVRADVMVLRELMTLLPHSIPQASGIVREFRFAIQVATAVH